MMVMGQFISNLLPQLPLLFVLVMGVTWARRQPATSATRYATWGLVILLVEAVVMTAFVAWWSTVVIVREEQALSADGLLTFVRVAGSLIQAGGFFLLLRAIFGHDFSFNARSGSCLLTFLGAVIGIVAGVVLALVLSSPIVDALNISDFEGASGYFVVLGLIPLFALLGGAVGAVAVWLRTRRKRDG